MFSTQIWTSHLGSSQQQSSWIKTNPCEPSLKLSSKFNLLGRQTNPKWTALDKRETKKLANSLRGARKTHEYVSVAITTVATSMSSGYLSSKSDEGLDKDRRLRVDVGAANDLGAL